MKFGRLQRLLDEEGVGRLWLVDDIDGNTFSVTGKSLRDAGVIHPAIGDTFEFLTSADGRATQLRAITE